MNESIINFLKDNWKTVLILLVLIFVLFQNERLSNAQKELEELRAKQSVATIIENIDKKLSEMKEREKLYEELESKLSSLEQARQSLKQAEAKLKQPNKGDITNENSKLNEKQLSDWFNLNGFNTSIGICK